jgi:hypothetical protein
MVLFTKFGCNFIYLLSFYIFNLISLFLDIIGVLIIYMKCFYGNIYRLAYDCSNFFFFDKLFRQ